MWNCCQCQEELDDSYDVCWNCGTAKDGTPDPEFQSENEEALNEGDTTKIDTHASDLPANAHETPCSHCGSRQRLNDVSISQGASAGSTGLEYKTAFILLGTEPLLADLCLGCGTVLRLHVRNLDRNWMTK